MSITYQVTVSQHATVWRLNGRLHREDGPAVEFASGTKVWYHNDLRHREDGPAIEYADGDKHWYRHGLCHREDGPAREYASGHKEWCLDDRLHREDGPAIEYANGSRGWYLNSEELTEEEFNARMNPVKQMTDIDLLKLALEDLEWARIILGIDTDLCGAECLDDVIAKIKARLENEDA